MSDFSYEIEKEIAILSNESKGWRKELNIISYNGAKAKYDIRDWYGNHEKLGKGITLAEDEARKLLAALQEEFPAYEKDYTDIDELDVFYGSRVIKDLNDTLPGYDIAKFGNTFHVIMDYFETKTYYGDSPKRKSRFGLQLQLDDNNRIAKMALGMAVWKNKISPNKECYTDENIETVRKFLEYITYPHKSFDMERYFARIRRTEDDYVMVSYCFGNSIFDIWEVVLSIYDEYSTSDDFLTYCNGEDEYICKLKERDISWEELKHWDDEIIGLKVEVNATSNFEEMARFITMDLDYIYPYDPKFDEDDYVETKSVDKKYMMKKAIRNCDMEYITDELGMTFFTYYERQRVK